MISHRHRHQRRGEFHASCARCFATVAFQDVEKHEKWHAEMEGAMEAHSDTLAALTEASPAASSGVLPSPSPWGSDKGGETGG